MFEAKIKDAPAVAWREKRNFTQKIVNETLVLGVEDELKPNSRINPKAERFGIKGYYSPHFSQGKLCWDFEF